MAGEDCLRGLRVVDLCTESGQLAGRILADLGAEVLVVEPPAGDPLRARGPFFGGAPHPDRGAAWIARNLGKRGLVIDRERAVDRARLRDLVGGADVLLESGDADWLAALGGSPQALRAAHPRLIVCSISPFGQTGPRAAQRGSDLTMLAACGNLHMTGDPDRPPLRCSLPVSHYHSGAEAALGVLMALWQRDRTAAGEHVDVAVQELMVMTNMSQAAQAWGTAQRGARNGSSYRAGATIQPEIWPCADGYVSFALRGGKARLPGLVAITAYLDDNGMAPPALRDRDWSGYNHNTLTQQEVDEIAAPFAAFFRTKTMRELYEAACERRLMLAPANTEREVLASRQLAARRFFTKFEAPGAAAPVETPARFAETDFARVRETLPLWGHPASGFSAPRFAAPRSAVPGESGQGIFAGLKILEFGAGAAAPLATRYFADQGATVVKVESRQRPDFLRTLRDDGSGKLDHSLFFACINPNKLSAGLNMKDERGIAVARRLIGWADVVVENFAPGVMRKWGLDYATMAAEYPGLIMVSTCLWGQTGPERAYPGFGGQGSALAGFNYLTGWPDRDPLGPFGTITDSLSPRFAALATVAALLRRARTGGGAYIDVSQVETGVYCLSEWLLAFQASGASFGRIGNRHTEMAPHGVFPCAGDDRWLALVVPSDGEWRRLCDLIGAAWAADADLDTTAGRLRHVDRLEEHLADWTRGQDGATLAARLQAAGIDAAVVADLQDVLGDAQLAHRGHFAHLRHAVLGDYLVEAGGLRFGGAAPRFARPAPCLAADNARVYRELLGMSDDEFAALSSAGVLS